MQNAVVKDEKYLEYLDDRIRDLRAGLLEDLFLNESDCEYVQIATVTNAIYEEHPMAVKLNELLKARREYLNAKK